MNDNNGENAGIKTNALLTWYNRKTYDQKFLVILFGALGFLLIAATVLIIVNVTTGWQNWYGFLIGTGIILCVILGQYSATKIGYYGDLVFDYGIAAVLCAILGARLYFVIFDLMRPDTEWDFFKFWNFFEVGGLAVFGGLIGAVCGVLLMQYIYKRFTKKPRMKFINCMDLAFTFIPLGQAIGRIGCYFADCCHGLLVTDPNLQFFPLAYQSFGHTAWHIPTFFYESVFNACLFAFLFISYLGKRKSFDGFNLSVYCIGYGICRAVLEGLRAPDESLPLIPGVLRVSQLVSIVICIFGVAWIVQYIVRAKLAGKKLMIFTPKDKLSDEYFGYENTIHAHPHVNPDGSPIRGNEVSEVK